MSFKLVDKIKKSNLPATLKRVLEAYVSFGNADGTSIRPTAAHVAKRATVSRTTIARHTPTLVTWGFLVHDRNEDGTYKVHNYTKDGVWAYVYHADLSPLTRPELMEAFAINQNVINEKRQAAGEKGGRPGRQMSLFDETNLIQTPQAKTIQTEQSNLIKTPPTNLQHRPDPTHTQPKPDPSVVSTTEKQSASKSDSLERPPVATADEEQEKPKPVCGDLANQGQEQNQISPKTKALVDELGWNAKIPAMLGISYFEHDHEPDMIRIVTVLRERSRSIHWLEAMIIWVKKAETRESKFWSTRIHTGTRAIGQIAKHLESGQICEQFDSFAVIKGGSDILDFGKAYNIFSEDCMREEREEIERRMAGHDDSDPAADDTAAQVAAGGFEVEDAK